MTLPSTAVETATAQCTSRCGVARGHRLNTSIVLAAVHGLSGLFRAVLIRGRAFTLSPPPPPPPRPPSPSLISNLASVDVKQHGLSVLRFNHHCDAVEVMFTKRPVARSRRIMADRSHTAHDLFQFSLPGRRYRAVGARASRLSGSLFHRAIGALSRDLAA